MKNVIKKISAIALAFTLLGTGTAVTKIIAPQFDTAITASAACKNHVVSSSSYGSWKEYKTTHDGWWRCEWQKWYKRTVKCSRCGKTLYTNYKKEYWKTYTSSTYTGNGISHSYDSCYSTDYWTEY